MNPIKFSLLARTLMCCLFAAALPRNGQAQELSKVAITYPAAGVAAINLHVAHAQGIFREEGLDAQLVRLSGNPAIKALTVGEVQVITNTASMIRTIERGKSKVAFKVLSIDLKRPLYWLLARPEYKSIPDVKGKVFGTRSLGNAPHVAAARLLRKGGVDPEKDVTVIVTPDDLQSLVKGDVQVTAVGLPSAIVARDKYKMNILGGAMGEYLDFSRGIAVREDFMRENREVIKRTLRALTRARRYVMENEQGASELLAKYTKVKLPVALESYRLARPAFTANGIPTEEEIREYLKTDAEAMKLPKPVQADSIFDFSLQREINRELGIK